MDIFIKNFIEGNLRFYDFWFRMQKWLLSLVFKYVIAVGLDMLDDARSCLDPKKNGIKRKIAWKLVKKIVSKTLEMVQNMPQNHHRGWQIFQKSLDQAGGWPINITN